MNTTHTIPSQSELLSGKVALCLAVVRDRFPAKYDWLRLAEGAATKAGWHITLGELPQNEGLDWIRVAVELYEAMADHPLTANNHASKLRLLMPAIGLRTLAIATWGANDNDPILNPDEISKRFFSIVKVSPKQLIEDRSFPRTEDIRNALEVSRCIDPLGKSEVLITRLPDVFEFYQAARIARENARTRMISDEELRGNRV
jgi:hypothetical protein